MLKALLLEFARLVKQAESGTLSSASRIRAWHVCTFILSHPRDVMDVVVVNGVLHVLKMYHV